MNEHFTTSGEVRSIEHVWIPMPDGVRLAARLWMPATLPEGGVPAIFEYIPYRKADMVRARDARNHPFLAENGYVALRVDIRGSGDSDGEMADMYTPDELADARHVIDWIAAQPWCNGRVGMFGTSWGGTASLQASVDAPNALKATLAVCATHDRYEDDIHHMGGCLNTDTFEWGATLPAILALPPTPQSGSDWYARWIKRLNALSFPVEHWVRHEARGTYWRYGSVGPQAAQFACPVLAVGGWADRYSNSVMSLVDANPDKVWGVVGPWGHHYPDHGHPGPAIGFQQMALEWWDHWLKPGTDGPAPWPKLRVWMREFDPPQDALERRNGDWVQSGPVSQDTAPLTLWLGEDQTLCAQRPVADGQWSVPQDLQHGAASGDTGYFGRFGGLPLAQNEDDARALCFETDVLDADLFIYGGAEITLEVSAEVARCQISVRLNDVSPEGVSARIGMSVLNLALDADLDAPDTPPDGTRRKVRVRLPTTAYRVRAGHRLRLAIGTSYWPLVWTPPQLGEVSITRGSLTLPTLAVGGQVLQTPFEPPHDLPVTKHFETLSAPALRRARACDADGQITTTWHQPLLRVHHSDIDTVFSYETRAEHSICAGDPNSARSEIVQMLQVERPDGCATVISRLRATCTAETYDLTGDIEVSWAGETIFERHWAHEIERQVS